MDPAKYDFEIVPGAHFMGMSHCLVEGVFLAVPFVRM